MADPTQGSKRRIFTGAEAQRYTFAPTATIPTFGKTATNAAQLDDLIASVTGHYNSTPPTVYMTAETHSRLMQAATRGSLTRMLDNVKRRHRAAQNRRTRRDTR